MKLLRLSFIVLFTLGILSPWVKVLIFPKHTLELEGETKKAKEVDFSLNSILDGSFQKNFLRWFKRNSGIRPYLIRTDNQINLALFRQLSSSYGSTAVLGKQNVLFERAYLPSASNLGNPKPKRIVNKVRQIKEMQELLLDRGVQFLLLISPNKASFQREHLPSYFLAQNPESRPNAYRQFVEELKAEKVQFFDSVEFLHSLRPENSYPFFPSSGTHWNDYAACLVAKELVARASLQLKKKLRSFTCSPVKWRDTPSYPERDLARLVNLWTPDIFNTPSPRPVHRLIADGDEHRPKVLFVGTSFLWAVLRYLDVHRVYRKRHMYYYFRTNHTYPKRKKIPIKKKELDWPASVFSNELIVVEINEAFVHKAGHGFAKHANEALSRPSERAGKADLPNLRVPS